jgi:HlyD family secretion protein
MMGRRMMLNYSEIQDKLYKDYNKVRDKIYKNYYKVRDKAYENYRKRPVSSIAVVLISILVLWGVISLMGGGSVESSIATFTVKKGPLRISVTESGTIQAREKMVIKNEVEGQSTIIHLIEEGAEVKNGDLLIELDSSNLVDQKVDQEIQVKNAEASYIDARENFEVVKNQAQSDQDKAQLAYDFAVQDLEKYIEGEYPNKLKDAEARITLAEEELARAQEELEWSKKLHEEKYISQTELQADELAVNKKSLDLDLARNDLELLVNYTHKRNLAQLESDVSQAKMALERTIRKATADVVQAEANLNAKELQYNRQKDKFKKIETQIEKCKIYAPADGTVIYATTAEMGGRRMGGMGDEPLEEGSTIRERRELIHLPTTSGLNVETSVLEADLDKVKVGLPVQVTVATLPDEVYYGRVASRALMADAMTSFLNPDLKEYDTTIYLDNNGNMDLLRTGMSCTAEIIVEQHTEAIYIPVQAVIRVVGKPTVYVVKGSRTVPREVEIGLDNNIMVRIISGLKEGEVVSLSPPLEEATVVENVFENIPDIPLTQEMTTGTGRGTGQVDDTGSGQQAALPGDGTVAGDFSQGRPSLRGGFIQFLDKDNDGLVSKDEFPGPDEFFGNMDEDGDGYLSESEMPQRPSGGSWPDGSRPPGFGPPSDGQSQDPGFWEGGQGQDFGPMREGMGQEFGHMGDDE